MSGRDARLLSLCALTFALALAFAAPALAAPKATEAAFTNPVAYELKSLLSTRFYCTVDTAGTWAVLDVFSADGIVKTVYSGPVSSANQRVYFPAWDGKDYLGRRMPSASYEWRLTLSKGGQSSVTRGKITVSKINFVLKGVESSDEGWTDSQNRYMLPGNANVYLQLTEVIPYPDHGGWLTVNLSYPPRPEEYDPSYQAAQAIEVGRFRSDPGTTLKQTIYLRGWQALKYRGSHQFDLSTNNADYYITVIQ